MTSIHAPTPTREPRIGLPAESRHGRFARRRHRARLYVQATVLVALLVASIVLVAANSRAVTLRWAFGSGRVSLDWIIVAAAVLGWLLGVTTAVLIHQRTRRPA